MAKPSAKKEMVAAMEAEPRKRGMGKGALVFLVLVSAVTYFVPEEWSAPWLDAVELLRVKEIVVETQAPLSEGEVKSWLPHVTGKNIFRLNSKKLVADLKKKPWVNEVHVRKILPARLVVSIQTRVPAVIAVSQGRSYFMDEDGFWIDRVGFRAGERHDFPVIQVERETDWVTWKIKDALGLMHDTEKELGVQHPVSQMVLGQYPKVRVFLERPRGLEITFNMETWRDQIPRLKYLLDNPPRPDSSMRRIDLETPKKAVVRLSLSN